MSAAALANLGKQDPLKLALGAVIVIAAVYYLTRQAVKDTASAVGAAGTAAAQGVGGLLTGNNAITNAARTDAYKGAGVVGTITAGIDNVLGGVPSKIGEKLGGWTYDIFNLDK